MTFLDVVGRALYFVLHLLHDKLPRSVGQCRVTARSEFGPVSYHCTEVRHHRGPHNHFGTPFVEVA